MNDEIMTSKTSPLILKLMRRPSINSQCLLKYLVSKWWDNLKARLIYSILKASFSKSFLKFSLAINHLGVASFDFDV